MRRLQEEIAIIKMRPKPEGQEGLPSEVQAAWETRFARVEEEFRKIQRQNSQWQGDSLKDFQSIESYLTQVHTMVTELHHRTETSSSSMPNRPRATRLAAAARKGDIRVEVESPEACRGFGGPYSADYGCPRGRKSKRMRWWRRYDTSIVVCT